MRHDSSSGAGSLSNDINWAYVAIEGAPRFVRRVAIGEAVSLRLSDESEVTLEPATLRQGPDGALYCTVPGELVARFDRHAMMQLAAITDEDAAGVYLTVGGRAVRPPVVSEPLARFENA